MQRGITMSAKDRSQGQNKSLLLKTTGQASTRSSQKPAKDGEPKCSQGVCGVDWKPLRRS